jgi:drug/metabolite transporter (DMT)-like permease
MTSKRDHAIGIAFLLLTAGCWRFVASTVKRLTADVDPYTISFGRVSMAVIVFVVLFVSRKGDWRRVQWLLPWVIVGALGRAGNYLLYNAGLVDMPSNAATILAPVQTISVAILARQALGESVRGKWPGLATSLAGLGLIWWNGQGWKTLVDVRYAWGNVMLVLAGVASAVQFCSQRALSPRMSSLEILIPVFGLSTLITGPFAWAAGGFHQAYGAATWGLLLFLGFVLTGGSFLFLAEGYKRCPATTGVVITNTSIFFTLLWSYALLREPVSVVMIVGACLGVAGAVAIVQADRQEIARRAGVEDTGNAVTRV